MNMSDYPYPTIGYSGSGIISRANMAVPTSDAGLSATTKGLGMAPHTAVPLLANQSFEARGRGAFDLDAPNVPDNDPRFTRGARITGERGTLDLWFLAPAAGTARTLCYLTDDPINVANLLAIRMDSSNRPLVTMTEVGGTTKATGVLATSLPTANVGNNETVVIDGKTYTFQAVLTEVDGNVFIGVDLATSLANLAKAINLGAGAGSDYAAATTLHPTVTASSTATALTVQAKIGGPGGNSITTTETVGTTKATGVLSCGGNFADTETVTIGSKTYTFQAVLTDVNGNVQLGGDLATSLQNLYDAINLTGTPGTQYATSMTLHPTVTATANDATTLSVEAKTAGANGNTIATTTDNGAWGDTTLTGGSVNGSWGGATLSGGAVGGTLVGGVTPSYPAITAGRLVHVRFAWDAVNPIDGTRHATLSINGEAIPTGDWATDPASAWTYFRPTHLVLGQGYGGDSDAAAGTIVALQASNVVQS